MLFISIEKVGFLGNLGFGFKINKEIFCSSSNSSSINDKRKNSLGYKDSLEGKYLNNENELIKMNKKLNSLLQVIEIENQKLSYNVINL